MAFDEQYHFGLIQLHAQQWLPFFTSQPDNASVYGALARDPSYLYHWLLSFPYRLISVFTDNQVAQIVLLRMLNGAMFMGALLLYRKILHSIGASNAVSNFTLGLFVMIPVVPFMAATINYDNLFFLVLAVTVLVTFKLLKGFEDAQIKTSSLLWLATLLVLGSIVKYTFLPVALATGLFVVWRAWRSKLLTKHGLQTGTRSFIALPIWRRVLLVLACVLALFLFFERYGQNLATYHNPVPACDDVLTLDECMSFGPFGRDQQYSATKPASFHANVVGYLWQWLYGMWYRLYFAINFDYATAPPLLILSRLGSIIAIGCVVGMIVRFKSLFIGKPLRFYLLLITLVYGLILFASGFKSYSETGQPVAINGRYLLPFLPFLLAFGVMAWSQILGHVRSKYILAAAIIVVTLFQGGGAVTFLIRSHDEWFWDNAATRNVNRAARSALWYTIPYKDTLHVRY